MSDEQQQSQSSSKGQRTPGQILREAREHRSYTQNVVAERLRLSLQTIIDIDNINLIASGAVSGDSSGFAMGSDDY